MPSLSSLNLSAAILHYVLACVFIGYFSYMNNKYPNQPLQGVELTTRDHTIGITKITNGNCVQDENTVCDTSGNGIIRRFDSSLSGTVSIKTIQGMLISFFLITGTFHLFYYLGNGKNDGVDTFGNKYTRMVENKNNYFRWIEYSITSTIMLYIIAYTSGIKDTGIYMMLYATNIAMIAQGQLVEEAIRDGKDWRIPMITGFLLLFAEFSVIIRTFYLRINQVKSFVNDPSNSNFTGQARIPSWINLMIWILFIFYSCFGIISLLGVGMKYESVEKGYIILSFAAKAVLGIFIAYGTGQRQVGWKIPNQT